MKVAFEGFELGIPCVDQGEDAHSPHLSADLVPYVILGILSHGLS